MMIRIQSQQFGFWLCMCLLGMAISIGCSNSNDQDVADKTDSQSDQAKAKTADSTETDASKSTNRGLDRQAKSTDPVAKPTNTDSSQSSNSESTTKTVQPPSDSENQDSLPSQERAADEAQTNSDDADTEESIEYDDEPVYTEEELQAMKAEAEALEKLVQEVIHQNKPEDQQSAKQVGGREVWIDRENGQVIAGGKICLRHGPLEMFACPRGTKEHESVISVNALSSQIHFCLVLCGAVPGHPVQWDPEYESATGPRIDVEIAWKDGEEIKRVSAQDMIRNMRTKEKMATHWVFGGSQLYEEEAYYGDAGELLCLSNFSTATMDIPIESVSNDAALLFEAHTDNIPEVNTQVFVYFKPVMDEPATKAEIQAELKRLAKLESLQGPASKKPNESPMEATDDSEKKVIDLSTDK